MKHALGRFALVLAAGLLAAGDGVSAEAGAPRAPDKKPATPKKPAAGQATDTRPVAGDADKAGDRDKPTKTGSDASTGPAPMEIGCTTTE